MNYLINRVTVVEDLGLMDYKAAWDYQEQRFEEIIAVKKANRKLADAEQQATANYLLLCEHPHVYTLGKSGKAEHLLLDEQGLGRHEASYYKINRGGDITYHGPGQLVIYPLLDLENFFTDIHKYLRLLEEAVIGVLADYGVPAGRIEGLTGVWIDFEDMAKARKICAMGVRSSSWVTMHGLAFNVNTDLSYFGHIVPCGIDDKAVTSLAHELGRTVPLAAVKEKMLKQLAQLFEMELAEG